MNEQVMAGRLLVMAKELLADGMPENQYKKLLLEYLRKNHLQFYRLVSERGSNEIVVTGWPRMQGQGVEAAGWMEAKWSKVDKFAEANGFRVRRDWDL